ncbi:hypothetical protein [Marinospirillum insulare]|uniref:Outer membrane protein beta-barrel domain-containing protein n=1 Tax=Marinospirillum insulare TaxID=217169 RepID=A0ABQ5ZVB6_9GAMM|nr:hypothetical protein [Marinospirillum insulare]GLR63386.1 hypothetical protein GCM10007878_08210 [Marinospirillum insulare]
MIKRVLLTAIFFVVALPVTSHADLIIGANISKSLSADLDLENDWDSISLDLDTSTTSFYIGTKNNKNNRFLVTFDNMKVDVGNYSSKATGFRLDWQFVYTEEKVKPYWGLGFGVYSLKEAPLVPDEKQSGVSFQAMGGAKIDLTENLELDLQLQFQGIVWQDVEEYICNYTYYSSYCYTETTSMSSSIISAGVGLAYKF